MPSSPNVGVHMSCCPHVASPGIWERILTFDVMRQGRVANAREATLDTLVALVCQECPPQIIGRGLCSIQCRHTSAYIFHVRRFGRELPETHDDMYKMAQAARRVMDVVRFAFASVFDKCLAPKPLTRER